MSCKEFKIRAGFVGFGEVNTPREFIVGRIRQQYFRWWVNLLLGFPLWIELYRKVSF